MQHHRKREEHRKHIEGGHQVDNTLTTLNSPESGPALMLERASSPGVGHPTTRQPRTSTAVPEELFSVIRSSAFIEPQCQCADRPILLRTTLTAQPGWSDELTSVTQRPTRPRRPATDPHHDRSTPP